ncbi:MAG: hypothetical protein H7239_09700 [Flavobacterium sp.]|nr:hypothetical protein [Flavobacterium sp.]
MTKSTNKEIGLMKPMQKAHTLPSRTSRPSSQNLAKSVLSPRQKEIQFFLSFPSEKIKTLDTQTNTTKTVELNSSNGLQTRWTRTPAGNSTYPKGGVSCSKDSFVVNQTLVFQIKFCGKSPALRVAAKR